jgi:tRNA dimethylallyltransferase
MKKKVIIIAGPTAVGKTAAALCVAQHYQTEIISADSRQCFRELNIGVARPSAEELALVPHHFIASHSIHEEVSAAVFEGEAMSIASNIFKHKDVLVVAGGTGLYIKAFMQGLDPIPAIDLSVRVAIQDKYNSMKFSYSIPMSFNKQNQDEQNHYHIVFDGYLQALNRLIAKAIINIVFLN